MNQLMSRLWCGFLVSVALTTTGAGSAIAETSHRVAVEPAPVASLEPAATAELWQRLVETRSRRARAAQADCRPLRAVFYAATDYLRLATKLAANGSPCAEYYVSIPPLVSDKTQPRRDAAWRIRALGPNFHALAEIHFATWTRWVASTGSSWFVAGTTARERMADAGYDVSKGDTWVLNEATSAVRRNTGQARANLREFLRGLYVGDGTRPTRGAVFVIGFGQQTSDLSLYQTNLQNWLSDSAFWADMTTYVSDWSQEVYGDVRNYAVPGTSTSTRRDYLNDYLQHKLVLAGVGPPTIDTARSYLQTAYSPLANAAWERDTAYGWTMIPAEQMAGYVSAQVYALRYFSTTTGQTADHWGFAWAPRNASSVPAGEFAAQTGQILDRLGAAVRDSGRTVDPEDPGSAACGPPGQNVWCVGDLEGARVNEAWKSFRVWTQQVLSFATPPQTIPAGTASSAMSLALVDGSGQPQTAPAPLTVTLSSSSPSGTFSTSPAGPWSATLALTIAAGTSTSGVFYYLDTRAGSALLTASAEGATSGTQTVTVTPGPLVSVAVSPPSAIVRTRSTVPLVAVGRDAYGNPLAVSAEWSLTPPTMGRLAPRRGRTTTVTAFRQTGEATVTAAVRIGAGTVSGTGAVHVRPDRLRIRSIGYRKRAGVALVTVNAVDSAGRPISRAAISVVVQVNRRPYFAARATTGAAGKTFFRVPLDGGGCFSTTIRRVSAPGLRLGQPHSQEPLLPALAVAGPLRPVHLTPVRDAGNGHESAPHRRRAHTTRSWSHRPSTHARI